MSAPGEKPYRRYRGGRTKGRVPTVGRPEKAPPRERASRDGRSRYRGPGPKPTARRPRQIRWGRELTIALVLIVLFFIVWAAIGYLVFRGGVKDANKRLPAAAKRALAPDSGSLFSSSTGVLMLGTDNSLAASRAGDRHSDSITILRTDPAHRRLYYLSIPRDLRTTIPGYGESKIRFLPVPMVAWCSRLTRRRPSSVAGIVKSSAGPMRPSTEPSSALLAGAANWSAMPAMLTTVSAPAEAGALTEPSCACPRGRPSRAACSWCRGGCR